MTRHFTELSDLGTDGLVRVLDAADRWQETRGSSAARRPLTGKSIALIFDKASTRTRLSLEVAVVELGGHPLVISAQSSQLGRGEPLSDTARVLSRMVHAVTFRTFEHSRLLELAHTSSVPVLNALTDHSHPMQLLADLQTVRRAKKRLKGLTYAWIGDGNNMANSWLEAAGLLQLDLALACPEGFDPDPREVERARERGAKIRVVRDPRQAVEDADVISTDVFSSMGQEDQQAARLRAFAGFQVDAQLVARARKDVMVLHCLPAHRGEEISAEVIDGPLSHVWDQAEARLHTSKAALEWALTPDD
ncbi:MAG TPA: ornithine carbamoyltransferase [Polyangiaceae bacterium]|nr:ornithine carbamoyltransferase [Polyangiaceae bacterium]